MSNTILTETDHEVNTEPQTAVTFADMRIGQRFFVTISGTRQLVEKTEYIKNGSTAHNVRKLQGRGGRGFVYRDATVTPEAQPVSDPWAFRRYVDDAMESGVFLS